MAIGNLPQPTEAGKNMISAGVSSYNGEGTVSFGVSTITEDNKYVIKVGGTADTRSNVSGSVSFGYQW
ncbi:YadA C-terminal domain-containing protein [Acinetobacter baumannii]|uniref:YadA C-terminal domain-containing protein n=1 Tax=Acinetobacter baumannii TaxID=470 RepID=UPI002255A126|nr:YadA C-terminal domain-containing protein [Acinetobacter baumannii]MCX3034118.1 YadA C-terminal domain-containing protein [Acinetobacter baumannii]